MPSNIIQINYSNKLTWEVGDSSMNTLIAYLNKIGDNLKEVISDASSSPCLQISSQA